MLQLSVATIFALVASTTAVPGFYNVARQTTAQPIPIPAPGDTQHAFQAPGPNDVRGPCPGMNTLANHGYIPRNGIATFDELVQGQMEVYNLAEDVAIVLAAIAISLDGEVATQQVSIGGPVNGTNPLGPLGSLLGPGQGGGLGLDAHLRFEGDTSLTRQDYWLNNGDDYSFDGQMYADMQTYANKYGNGTYNNAAMSYYRKARYDDSRARNSHFYMDEKSLLLFGAASFVYESFSDGRDMIPSEHVVSSFFGAQPDSSAAGGFVHIPERIPDGWYRRATPYTLQMLVQEAGKMMSPPNNVTFGANIGPGQFFGVGADGIPLSTFDPTNPEQVNTVGCAIWQLFIADFPSEFQGTVDATFDAINFALNKMNPQFHNTFGCDFITANKTANGVVTSSPRKSFLAQVLSLTK